MKIPRVLSIAGSDSSAGAGIQADLKTFSALRVYGMSAVTALTSQNTLGVTGVVPVAPDFVSAQIVSVATDIGVDAVKTGMLCNSAIITSVVSDLARFGVKNLVVDPVMISTSGRRLLDEEAEKTLVFKLLPMALVVTPNLHEAEVLSGVRIERLEDMKRAAEIILRLGCANVVLKGGHLPGEPVDLLYDGVKFFEFSGIRHETVHTHGSGCTFASAVAAFIARDFAVEEAVGGAKTYVSEAIAQGLRLGRGFGPLHHFHPFYRFDRGA